MKNLFDLSNYTTEEKHKLIYEKYTDYFKLIISDEWYKTDYTGISIPMLGYCDSLNVGIATPLYSTKLP
ncbi:hypothetical protein [Clostridium sp.]|uniref:hypothetical protein n=1 Tax=Clostridium sp. TaxID=1506 RepID=UPI003464D59C